MKLYAVLILNKGAKVNILKSACDLQSFGYFQRSRYSISIAKDLKLRCKSIMKISVNGTTLKYD